MFDIIATAGSMLGPLLGYQGQMQTNQSNETISKDASAANFADAAANREFQATQASANRGFQHDEAANQMQFQERMSSTAFQRAAADMKAAGINPLSMSNGGASTPSGASGSGSSVSGAQGSSTTIPMQNPAAHLTTLVSSALDSMKTIGEIKNQSAAANLMNAQAKNANASAGKTDIDAAVAKKGLPGADLATEAYSVVKPIVQKVKQFFQSTPEKTNPLNWQPSEKFNKQFKMNP